ncbi:MAG: vWA domain-containing protein [Bradymonadia bacterium]
MPSLRHASLWALCLGAACMHQGCGGAAHKAESQDPGLSPSLLSGRPAPASQPPKTPFDGVQVLKKGVDADMFFRHYGVNPTIETSAQPVSTFSVDVDTASYSLTRAFLDRGVMPQEASVRVEEFVNALTYDDPPPQGPEQPFAVHGEIFPSPNRTGYHILRLGLRGRVIHEEDRKAADLVFVIDVSGSMNRDDRLGLVKRSLMYLVDHLGPDDTVAVVTYGDDARLALPPTGLDRRDHIVQAISALAPQGSTHAQAGLEVGYNIAAQNVQAGRISRVILCSDGVANSGVVDPDALYGRIRHAAEEGVWLTTMGVGMGNYNDVLMERLAQLGQGRYLYIDGDEQARRAFTHALTGNLQVIAKDVKVQMQFDPGVVARYRLLGYENRLMAAEDFANDRVDAGEIGAGHQMTALYELKLTGAVKDLGQLRIRHKSPEGHTSQEMRFSVGPQMIKRDVEAASPAGRLAWIAAGFAEKLRGAYWARNLQYESLQIQLGRLPGDWRERRDVVELGRLIERARQLDTRADRFEGERPLVQMDFDHVPILSDSGGGRF